MSDQDDKYGFGGIQIPQDLTAAVSKKTDKEPVDLHEALKAGEKLGFVRREPAQQRRKPGPRRTEPQDKVSIPGPKRVIDDFRDYCDAEGLTLWQGLEVLLRMRR
ncbi:hypothetical protein [Gemmobacter nectariphilus]|uniref:hypothetical protein n=1 Tax=Gemmobacter nectariphilus TaxID=220343 RepID=UPI00040F57D8|nr:hypothetical protein [Gemmobacter nectariphilus]